MLDMILSQMNNNRLSTNVNKQNVDTTRLQAMIDNLLLGPSNFETQADGRILIKSTNKYYLPRNSIRVALQDESGVNFKIFDTIKSCAEFLQLSPYMVKSSLKKTRVF